MRGRAPISPHAHPASPGFALRLFVVVVAGTEDHADGRLVQAEDLAQLILQIADIATMEQLVSIDEKTKVGGLEAAWVM